MSCLYYILGLRKAASITPGQPRSSKAAVLDIISPDVTHGPIAAGAEILSLINECLVSFPTLAQTYEIHISHSNSEVELINATLNPDNYFTVVDAALKRVPDQFRSVVLEVMSQSKSLPSQKRAFLVRRGLPQSVIDELELFADAGMSLID